MAEVFFTSDTHFGHYNIIAYCKRPFESVEEMNEGLISRWNAKVGKNDLVYHLGDFAFAKPDEIRGFVRRLHGKIVLVLGNHDRHARGLDCFYDQADLLELRLGNGLVLCHYPIRQWNGSLHGGYHFYGHTHGQLKPLPGSLEVGVDVQEYVPITFDEARARINLANSRP